MSPFEIAILLAMALVLFIANVLATLHTRYLGAYGFPYLLVIWFLPLVGALFVLAKLQPKKPASFALLGANTLSFSNNPLTIPVDPWPSISPSATHPPKRFNK
jgi:FtsH-binding integral membrane protein